MFFYDDIYEVFSYPWRSPVGPIEVANIRLNSAGSVISLLVPGNFALYLLSCSDNAF